MKVYKSRRDWVYVSIFLGITLLFAVILVLSYFDVGFLGLDVDGFYFSWNRFDSINQFFLY